MTMHLLPVYYSTTSTRKRKKTKKTKSLLKAESEHQKFLNKMKFNNGRSNVPTAGGRSSVGRASGLQPEGRRFNPYRLHQTDTSGWNLCTKSEPKVYSGTEVIGIAQMHKSNAVPITRKKDAIAVANMRR